VHTRALKTEPIRVVLEQRGEYGSEGSSLPFRTTMEFPNTKSWIRLAHEIEDPRGELSEIVLRMPFALATEPRLFDFGVGSWLYGALKPGQAAILTQRVAAAPDGATDWNVTLGSGTTAPPYAAGSPADAMTRAEGWAHLMDAQKVIALGVADFLTPGVNSIRLDHDGDCEIRWRPEAGGAPGSGRRHRVEAYFHFIPFPPQLTAATSPPAMLAPLAARCAPDYYPAVGVDAPK
jgi:hypothetical protein